MARASADGAVRVARQLAAAAERGGFRYDAKAVKRADPNKRRRWLIPVILAAQVQLHSLLHVRM